MVGLSLQNPIKMASKSQPQNPRKVQRGTSYQSRGLIADPHLDDESGSALPAQIREIVPALSSPLQRQQTFARMMDDAGVDVSVRAVKTPVLGAEFFMEPYSDDPNDILISEFIWDNLAGGMSAPFLNSLEDILHFYEDAYAVLEKVYEKREWSPKGKGSNTKVYTMLKKLGVRPVNTLGTITYDDNGGPNSILQNAIRSDGNINEVELDISKLLIFTFNRKGGDITGKSILRTAYPHWYYKTHFYKVDAIQKERHSLGVPKGKLLPGFNNKDKKILRTLLRNLRANEEAFIMETPNVEITFAEFKGDLVDVLKSADHHNVMILLNVMAQFLVMGTQGTSGGRATAGSHVDMFMKSLKYVANYIADVINMYLIPELVVWNFPTTNFPKLQVRNIGETRDLQMFSSALSNLFAQKAITDDDDTEQWLRKIFDMPAKQAGSVSRQADTSSDTPVEGSNGKGGTKPNAVKSGNVGKPTNSAQ